MTSEESLLSAIKNKDTDGIRMLLTTKVNVNYKHGAPLALAVKLNQLETLRLLIQFGADYRKHTDCIVRASAFENHREIARFLLNHGNYRVEQPDLAYDVLAGIGELTELQTLTPPICKDLGTNRPNRIGLSWAAKNGHEAVVKHLFAHIPNITPSLYTIDLANKNGHPAIARILCRKCSTQDLEEFPNNPTTATYIKEELQTRRLQILQKSKSKEPKITL